MLRMKANTRRMLFVIVAGFMFCARFHPAAAGDAINSQWRLSIAASYNPASDDISWHSVTQIIASDLKASGRFVLIELDRSIDENVHAVPQFDQWRRINTEWLVTGRVTPAANQRFKIEFRLWDVVKGQQVLGQQYFFGLEEADHVTHIIAEAILKRLRDEATPR
jgi:Tol biopolymer transport system component